jgi:hypothetical protein
METAIGAYMKRLKEKFIEKLSEYQSLVVVTALFFLNLFFVLSELTPRLCEINPHDGAKYIESGRLLLEWGLRDLAWGPLVAFIYAPLHLIVGNSLNWFIIEAWAGNIILFGLVWFSFYNLASKFDKYISKFVIFVILFSTTVFFPIIENQSDALFVALSSFALAKIINFLKKGDLKNMWFASLFVGLGVLSRVETIILIIPLIVFSLILNKGKYKVIKVIVASILPIVVLISLYVTVNLMTLGYANLGMGYKSYESFQMNQAFIPGSKNEAAYYRGENIFGTAEENQGSVFRAILQNPIATGERALANLLKLPESFPKFFGNLQAPIIFIFSVIGLYKLIKDKKSILTSIMLVWPLHAFVSLIFLPRHIIPQMSYLFIILSGIGITYTFSEKANRTEKFVFFFGSLIMLITAIFTQNKILFSGGILIFIISLLILFIDLIPKGSENIKKLPIFLLIIGLLLYGNGFTFPAKTIGQSEQEQAVQQLQMLLPSNSRVLVPFPTIATAAKMTPVEFPSTVDDVNEFISFLRQNDIDAIYLSDTWPKYSEFIQKAINKYQGNFQVQYKSGSEEIFIYSVDL